MQNSNRVGKETECGIANANEWGFKHESLRGVRAVQD
jgi:hypothetical protein